MGANILGSNPRNSIDQNFKVSIKRGVLLACISRSHDDKVSHRSNLWTKDILMPRIIFHQF
jgi:hypothetical protein